MKRTVLHGLILLLICAAYGQQEPPKHPLRVRVSEGVSQRNLKHSVQPKYPKEAKEQGIQGDVGLRIVIDKEGNVAKISTVFGDPLLVAAATDAVQKWKYKPYSINGEPVEVETQITVRFHLHGG